MLPLRDANPRSTTPVITVFLILANAGMFLYQASLAPRAGQEFVYSFAIIPARFPLAFTSHTFTLSQAFAPLLTSMFLHGGLMHLLGNMWFLWVFGDNIEDRLGHFAYLAFYAVCGVGAGLVHTAFSWGSTVPAIGASGAVSGVLGAYLVLYPGARVLTWVPPIFIFPLPALIVLGYWFVIQFLSGLSALGANLSGGVAWWAHVGGFILGAVLALGSRSRRP